MCPSAPRVCSEPGGQKPVLLLSLERIIFLDTDLGGVGVGVGGGGGGGGGVGGGGGWGVGVGGWGGGGGGVVISQSSPFRYFPISEMWQPC